MAHNDVEGLVIEGEALLLAHVDEVSTHLVRRDGVEVEALHAREDGGEDLLRIRRAHDEDDVRRRLLERLEQRVERRGRQHVDLVDDVDLVAAAHRRVVDAVDDLLAHVVDARAACRIELVDIRVLAGGDEAALLAGAIRQVAIALLAHKGLRKDACHGGLAGTTRAAEEVRMARATLAHGALERRDHVRLANYLLKRLRTIFAIQRLHGTSGNRNGTTETGRARLNQYTRAAGQAPARGCADTHDDNTRQRSTSSAEPFPDTQRHSPAYRGQSRPPSPALPSA